MFGIVQGQDPKLLHQFQEFFGQERPQLFHRDVLSSFLSSHVHSIYCLLLREIWHLKMCSSRRFYSNMNVKWSSEDITSNDFLCKVHRQMRCGCLSELLGGLMLQACSESRHVDATICENSAFGHPLLGKTMSSSFTESERAYCPSTRLKATQSRVQSADWWLPEKARIRLSGSKQSRREDRRKKD